MRRCLTRRAATPLALSAERSDAADAFAGLPDDGAATFHDALADHVAHVRFADIAREAVSGTADQRRRRA